MPRHPHGAFHAAAWRVSAPTLINHCGGSNKRGLGVINAEGAGGGACTLTPLCWHPVPQPRDGAGRGHCLGTGASAGRHGQALPHHLGGGKAWAVHGGRGHPRLTLAPGCLPLLPPVPGEGVWERLGGCEGGQGLELLLPGKEEPHSCPQGAPGEAQPWEGQCSSPSPRQGTRHRHSQGGEGGWCSIQQHLGCGGRCWEGLGHLRVCPPSHRCSSELQSQGGRVSFLCP